jgi:hypothetical protein
MHFLHYAALWPRKSSFYANQLCSGPGLRSYYHVSTASLMAGFSSKESKEKERGRKEKLKKRKKKLTAMVSARRFQSTGIDFNQFLSL